MTTDISGSEQTHQYFLQEATELLQTMDDELQDLREAFTVQKVHNLMRAAHTLKGASASVGLEAVKKTTHSLEDVFKALCYQDTVISIEMEGLIFQSYDCLKLLMSAQLADAQVDEADILDRMAAIVTRLQAMLGDRFGQGGHLPTSSELGFDMTQSIFEVGVAQRIEELEEALEDLDPEELFDILETQAEVFIGLAESLDLPGFGDIAATVLAAIEDNPDQVLDIAPVALADYKAAQTAVFGGDREQGGEPSSALRQFCISLDNSSHQQLPVSAASSSEALTSQREDSSAQSAYSIANVNTGELTPIVDANASNLFQQVWTFLTRTIRQVTTRQKKNDADYCEANIVSVASDSTTEDFPATLDAATEPTDDQAALDDFEQDDLDLPDLSLFNASLEERPDRSGVEPDVLEMQQPGETALVPTPPIVGEQSALPLSEASQEKLAVTAAQQPKTNATTYDVGSSTHNASIRMTVGSLDHLNQSMGELLTQHNRLALYNEQLSALTKTLIDRISQQRNQLNQPLSNQSAQQQQDISFLSKSLSLVPSASLLPQSSLAHFDTLELDQYSDIQLLAQSFLEETAQQSESVEAIELFVSRSAQALAKQKQLLASTRKTLLSARMLPLESILKRFSPALERLKAQHKKQVTLTLVGSGVLVDKVIVDKLYDPLLHLVRNAFDHGIEPPAQRLERNKPAAGNITIKARQQGRHLVIDVKDDGQGLDLERIRQKAIDTQLITADEAAALTPDQTIDLLFEAGFSTASEIDDLSGRGVGLDAVQAQVRSLKGWIAVSHEPGMGTCFSLQIPSSLTIGKLLLCQAQERTYAIMPDSIEHIFIPKTDQLRVWEGNKTLTWRANGEERLVPVYSLTDMLQYTTPICDHQMGTAERDNTDTPLLPVILLNYQNALVGIEVDQLLGEQELVINTLGKSVVPPAYVYGSSVLPDGQLTLVVDGTMLAKIVIERRSKHTFEIDPTNDLNIQDESSTQKQQDIASQSDAPSLLNRLILTVDDSITVRNTLVDALQKSGYKVIQARDGVEALQQLRQYPNVSAILCDIEMPGMNGFEFLKARQQTPEIVAIPTIMLTSREGAKHRLLTKELGATAYLTKPYLIPQLLKAVADAIENKELQTNQPVNA
ncbi:MAG: response regulator [Cyanobacteria bacterium J06648_10]